MTCVLSGPLRPTASHLTYSHIPHLTRQVDANLAAADIPLDLFDAIVSADAFEHLKPSPGEGARWGRGGGWLGAWDDCTTTPERSCSQVE